MSGPTYPPEHNRSTAPGGQLPETAQLDYWTTILSQFANSEILTAIIANVAGYLDQRASFDDFYRLVRNVDTAEGYGLDVWGRIVGVNRVLQVQSGSFFGFQEAYVPNSASITTLNDAASPRIADAQYGPFFTGEILTDNFRLADQAYRLLILAKAAANITDGSIPAINRILMSLFPGRGNCYVTEIKPTSYFGFGEAAVTRPTYVRGFNRLQDYTGPYLWFAEARPDGAGLDQAPLYTGTAQGAASPSLSVACAPFYSGQDNPYRAMTYTFEFPLTPVELAIVQQSGVLPKPAGVAASVAFN